MKLSFQIFSALIGFKLPSGLHKPLRPDHEASIQASEAAAAYIMDDPLIESNNTIKRREKGDQHLICQMLSDLPIYELPLSAVDSTGGRMSTIATGQLASISLNGKAPDRSL